jgi:phosphoribosylanthranilate isomerase
MKNNIIIQIYEVQTASEAEKLIELGVNHIGSVIVSAGEWRIPIVKETTNFIDSTGSMSSLIMLFSEQNNIFRALDYYRPDILHFCEDIASLYSIYGNCEDLILLQQNIKEKFPEIKLMRSIPITQSGMKNHVTSIEFARMFEPVSDYFLTDTWLVKSSGSGLKKQPVEGFVGITGRTCDWNIAAELVESSSIPVILAGGLTPDNVFDGIMRVCPAGVDSCTGTNSLDFKGKPIRFQKDLEKVKRFVEEARRAENKEEF